MKIKLSDYLKRERIYCNLCKKEVKFDYYHKRELILQELGIDMLPLTLSVRVMDQLIDFDIKHGLLKDFQRVANKEPPL